MKKAWHYIPLAIFLILTALWAGTLSRAGQAGTWLCSGRFIAETGFVIYDIPLAIWLAVDGIIIGLAYFGIPSLIRKVRTTRKDINGPMNEALQKFGIFILACGVGHIIDSINIYLHWYYFAAGWHLFTAIVSVDTLLTLRRKGHYFLALPSRKEHDQFLAVSDKMQRRNLNGFWWYEFATGEVRWTDGAKAIYGKPSKWKVNLDEIDQMIAPEYRISYEREVRHHRENGGEKEFQYGIIVNGEFKLIQAGIFDDFDEKGNHIGIYGYIENMTGQAVTAHQLIVSTIGNTNEKISSLMKSLIEIQLEITKLKLDGNSNRGSSNGAA